MQATGPRKDREFVGVIAVSVVGRSVIQLKASLPFGSVWVPMSALAIERLARAVKIKIVFFMFVFLCHPSGRVGAASVL
jgi:hypothetical protein